MHTFYNHVLKTSYLFVKDLSFDVFFQIDMLKKTIKSFYGEIPKDSGCISKIVNKNHFLRLSRYLDDPRVKASMVHGGSTDEEKQ